MMISLNRLASYYLNYPTEFSVLRDLYGYPEPPRTLSLRERLRYLESFADRRKALIQAWVGDWKAKGIGPEREWTTPKLFKDNHERTFRRIAAGLMALKDNAHFGEEYDPAPPSDFPRKVEEWCVNEFRVVGFLGSAEEWWKKDEEKPGFSHDMVMKEIVSLLYVFREDRELLRDDACFALINIGLKDFLNEGFGLHLKYTLPVPSWAHGLFIALIVGGPLAFGAHAATLGGFGTVAVLVGGAFIAAVVNRLTYPETENHVLMAYTSIYLARQWVKRNPRKDSRLNEGRYAEIRDSELDDQIEDLLLQAAGRVVHSGLFETNGRPYLAFSVHPFMNLHSFAEREEIRTAAGNALDFAYASFAFRSWQGEKDGEITVGPAYSPFRRNNKSADDVSIYGTEASMMITLLGEPPWDDSYWAAHLGNPAGFSLWAMLLEYRPHEVITDFALKEHLFAEGKGYWARMQSRYTLDHYRRDERPGYFESDGRVFRAGADIRSAPEVCFVTKEFMNAGGGRFDRYEVQFDAVVSKLRKSPDNTHEYDFIARPQIAFVDKAIADFEGSDKEQKIDDMRATVMFMFGHRDFWLSDNSGVYKGFAYGYFKHRDSDDRHSDFPMNIPPAWLERRLQEDGEHVFRNSSGSRVVFIFYDLGERGVKGPFVITGRASKSRDRRRYRAYARGFWELVPSGRFDSVSELKDWVLAHNPDEQFSDTTEGERRHYLYTMTTGETVQLNDLLGHGWSGRRNRWVELANPIRKVWAQGATPLVDQPLPLKDLAVNQESTADIDAMPLLHVAEVDKTLGFTGRLFAAAAGDGRLRITNPFLNYELIIDSRDYKSPVRSGRIQG
jgi:hypothetical protein